MILAALMVVLGVSVERWKGCKADEIVDQIRTTLQTRIIQVSPRSWLLTSDVQERVIDSLKAFTGQRIAVFVNQKYVEDKFEAMAFAMSLDSLLNNAGWLAPSGKKILDNGQFTNIWYDPPRREGVNAIAVETDPKAVDSVKKAARALNAVLVSADLSSAYWSDKLLRTFGGVPVTPGDTIAITIGRRPLP